MRNYFTPGNLALLDDSQAATPLQEAGFDAGWQQLQRVNHQTFTPLVDTVQEPVVQEEVGWQPVLLSGGKALDRQTLLGLTGLENSLQALLAGNLLSAAPAEYRVENFTEVVIPQYNARLGAWQMSA